MRFIYDVSGFDPALAITGLLVVALKEFLKLFVFLYFPKESIILSDNTQHTQQTNIHSNPQSQQASGRRPVP